MILAVVGQTADAGNPTSELDIVTYEKPVDLGPEQPSSHNIDEALDIDSVELTAMVQTYCMVCHNDAMMTGNMSLNGFAVENASARAETGVSANNAASAIFILKFLYKDSITHQKTILQHFVTVLSVEPSL